MAVSFQDALAALSAGGGRVSVPPGGIKFACEACGRPYEIKRWRRITRTIGWATVPEAPLDLPPDVFKDLLAAQGLPHNRTMLPVVEDTQGRLWVTRLVVVGSCCQRARVGRCAHEDRIVCAQAGRSVHASKWARCTAIVRGHAVYCPEHRDRVPYYRRRRTPDLARRSPLSRQRITWVQPPRTPAPVLRLRSDDLL